jgi:hypothetical protein
VILVIVTITLFALDLGTTLVGIRVAGPDVEDNGIHRAVIGRFGVVGFLVVYAAVAGLLIAVGGWTSPILLLGLTAGLVPVVANNVWQLGRWWCAQRRRRVAQVR